MCYHVGFNQISDEAIESVFEIVGEQPALAYQKLTNENASGRFRYGDQNGFTYPFVAAITMSGEVIEAQWGLIPQTRPSGRADRYPNLDDEAWKKKIRSDTLNARSETMFKYPSFKLSAETDRCTLLFSEVFEHKEVGEDTKEYYSIKSSKKPLLVACGLLSRRPESVTWSLVMTDSNAYYSVIKNGGKNPRRMPVFLWNKGSNEEWMDRSRNSYLQLDHLFVPDDGAPFTSTMVTPARAKAEKASAKPKSAARPKDGQKGLFE